ncbi:cell envelope integrity protein TolA [Sporosarcina contaminans]|uniref:Cell envelope integrity protein TolA n=1 Tax=Sporosarcina contaminans TaxID=633403 RepID=A0ABW3TXB7_9BACL
MKNIEWKMEEVFYFPPEIGLPKHTDTIRVKAGFTEKRSEEAVRLTGIYHIAAKIDFEEGQRAEDLSDSYVYIDDVELDGQKGYFEYAVPLHVDLPAEVQAPLQLTAKDVKTTIDDQGAFKIVWNVNCSYVDGREDKLVEKTEKKTVAQQEVEPQAKDTSQQEIELKNKLTAKEKSEPEDKVTVREKNEPNVNATAKLETETKEKAVAKQVSARKEESVTKQESDAKETAVAQPTSETENKADTTEVMSNHSEQAETKKETTVNKTKPNEEVANLTVLDAEKGAEQPIAAGTSNAPTVNVVAMHDSSSYGDYDDMLSYIAGLPDEWSTTSFRSNDVFVQ